MHTPIWVSVKHPLPTHTAALLPHLHPRQRPRHRLHLLPQPRSHRLRSLLPPVLVSPTAGTSCADTVEAAEHAAGAITGTNRCIRFRLQLVQDKVQTSKPTSSPAYTASQASIFDAKPVEYVAAAAAAQLHEQLYVVLACAAVSSVGSGSGRASPLSPSDFADNACATAARRELARKCCAAGPFAA